MSLIKLSQLCVQHKLHNKVNLFTFLVVYSLFIHSLLIFIISFFLQIFSFFCYFKNQRVTFIKFVTFYIDLWIFYVFFSFLDLNLLKTTFIDYYIKSDNFGDLLLLSVYFVIFLQKTALKCIKI